MKIFDLYGLKENGNLESARQLAEQALRVSLAPHSSSYVGKYYRFGLSGSENFVLQENFNESEQELNEKAFKEFPILLYINESQQAEFVENLLRAEGFVLLRREKL
jgi:hypothetical protein